MQRSARTLLLVMLGLAGSLVLAGLLLQAHRRMARTPSVELFSVPTENCGLSGLAVAPNQDIWFTERLAGKLGRISARRPGEIREFPITPPTGLPGPIAVASDGIVWVAETRGVRLVGVDPRNPSDQRAIPLLTTQGEPRSLVPRPDGTLLLSQPGADIISRIDTRPPYTIREFRLPTHFSSPTALAVTPDGRIWFAEDGNARIGSLTPGEPPVLREALQQAIGNTFSGVTIGPDGNVWFTFGVPNRIARVTPDFSVTEFPLPTADVIPRDPVVGEDGAIWFLEAKARRLGRIEVTPPYRILEFDLPGVTMAPAGLAVSRSGDLWFLVPDADAVARFTPPGSLARRQLEGTTGAELRPVTYRALPPPTPTGVLHVTVDEATSIGMDGSELARLRERESRVLVVPVGRHRVVATVDGQEPRVRTVDVWSGLISRVGFEWHSEYTATDEFVPVMPALGFSLVPAGEFVMGRGSTAPDAAPFRRVRFSSPFEMTATEVTQGQWLSVMGKNPTDFENRGDDRPMQKVSWDDAQAFIERLSRLDPAHTYRLPTEAEWEYAARAGDRSECPALDPTMGWFGESMFGQVHPVATKLPNAWRLYDLVGNAGEWCSDWYDPDTYRHDGYSRPVVVDPVGPDRGGERVVRGLSAAPGRTPCWVDQRWHFPNTSRIAFVGFRIIRKPR